MRRACAAARGPCINPRSRLQRRTRDVRRSSSCIHLGRVRTKRASARERGRAARRVLRGTLALGGAVLATAAASFGTVAARWLLRALCGRHFRDGLLDEGARARARGQREAALVSAARQLVRVRLAEAQAERVKGRDQNAARTVADTAVPCPAAVRLRAATARCAAVRRLQPGGRHAGRWHPHQARSHLFGRGAREGDREDAVRRHAACEQVLDPAHHYGGLTRARAREHGERLVGMRKGGLALHAVQVARIRRQGGERRRRRLRWRGRLIWHQIRCGLLLGHVQARCGREATMLLCGR